MKQELIKLQKEIDKLTTVVDFNMPLTEIARTRDHKITKTAKGYELI